MNDSWIGCKMMNPEGQVGKVIHDANNTGRVRILTVEFEDGHQEPLYLSNTGPNPSESQKWKWFYDARNLWVEWGQ